MDVAAPQGEVQQTVQAAHTARRHHRGQVGRHAGRRQGLEPAGRRLEGGLPLRGAAGGVVRAHPVQAHPHGHPPGPQLPAERRCEQRAVGLDGGVEPPSGGPAEVQHLRRRVPAQQGLPASELDAQGSPRRAGQIHGLCRPLGGEILTRRPAPGVAVAAGQITAVGEAQHQGVQPALH